MLAVLITAPAVQAAIQTARPGGATGELIEPSTVEVSPDKTVRKVILSVKSTRTDAASNRSLDILRTELSPATVGKVPGIAVVVTGMTAGSKDVLDVMHSHLPIVFGFVLSLGVLLLLVTFRSIVVPITAIILNLLAVPRRLVRAERDYVPGSPATASFSGSTSGSRYASRRSQPHAAHSV